MEKRRIKKRKKQAHRILNALFRMQRRNHDSTIYYENLQAKLIDYINGRGEIVDVTEGTIGVVGSLLAKISKSTIGRST